MKKAAAIAQASAPISREGSEPRGIWRAFPWAALGIGIALRFTWLSDMEFKGDESWMFRQAVTIGRTAPWPGVGMPSGVGLHNPGMSVWVFVALARVFQASTPLQLGRAAVTLNAAALIALMAFIRRCVPTSHKEVWLWVASFVALSPIDVLLQRKIWAQSILPIFCVACLWAWWRRDRALGAAAWGFVAALLGQIHMSGFFFSGAFFLVTLISDRIPGLAAKRTRWGFWLVGSVLGAIPLLPWLKYVASGVDRGPGWSWEVVRQLTFFRFWGEDVAGLGLDYNLGASYPAFLSYPATIGEVQPGLLLQGITLGCLAIILASAAVAAWSGRKGWRAAWTGAKPTSDTLLAPLAGLFAFGISLTAASVTVFRHYLIVTYPLEILPVVWLAFRCAPRPRWVLLALCLSQLSTAMCFLGFIHQTGGAYGDYGRAYRGN